MTIGRHVRFACCSVRPVADRMRDLAVIHALGELLHMLEPGSVLWLAVAEERGRALRRHFATHLRWSLVGEPTSVIHSMF